MQFPIGRFREIGWSQASYRFACQVLAAHGKLKSSDICSHLVEKDKPMPECFDDTNILRWSFDNTMQFDETHKRQRVGPVKSGKMSESVSSLVVTMVNWISVVEVPSKLTGLNCLLSVRRRHCS